MTTSEKFKHLSEPVTRYWLETIEGQRALGLVHCFARSAFEMAGAVQVTRAMQALSPFPFSLELEHVSACFERLDELGEAVEVTTRYAPDEFRVYVPTVKAGATTSWQRLRQAAGVVQGAPADAIVDAEALYDEPILRSNLAGCANPLRDCARDGDCPEHGRNRPGQGQCSPVAEQAGQHLRQVIVLTVLESEGFKMTIDELCERASGERSEVLSILLELALLGKIDRNGTFVWAKKPRVIRDDVRTRKLRVALALEQAEGVITIDELCAQVSAERAAVVGYLRELLELGSIRVAGEFVAKVAPELPRGDDGQGSTVSGSDGCKGRSV